MRESKLWSWHILTAIIILFVLGVHMGIMHLGEILSAIGIGSADPVQVAIQVRPEVEVHRHV